MRNKKKWVVVHIEDEGEARADFQREILPPSDYPFEIEHLNPVEEIINFEEILQRASQRTYADFFVIDLALSNEEHTELDRWFSEDSYPSDPPESFGGGISVAYRLVKEFEVEPRRIAFLTRHESKSLFRDLNKITKHWLDYHIPAFYKGSKDNDLAELRNRIFEACNYSPSDNSTAERGGVLKELSFVFATDDVDLSSRFDVSTYGIRSKLKTFKTKKDDPKGFRDAIDFIKSELETKHVFAVIDITSHDDDREVLKNAMETESRADYWDIVGKLNGIKALKEIRDEVKRDAVTKGQALTTIAAGTRVDWPKLVRFCMDSEESDGLGVDFVMDESDFSLNFASAVKLFIRLHNS